MVNLIKSTPDHSLNASSWICLLLPFVGLMCFHSLNIIRFVWTKLVITLSDTYSSWHLWSLIITINRKDINWRKNASKRFETKTKQKQKQKAHTLCLSTSVGTTSYWRSQLVIWELVGSLHFQLITITKEKKRKRKKKKKKKFES